MGLPSGLCTKHVSRTELVSPHATGFVYLLAAGAHITPILQRVQLTWKRNSDKPGVAQKNEQESWRQSDGSCEHEGLFTFFSSLLAPSLYFNAFINSSFTCSIECNAVKT